MNAIRPRITELAPSQYHHHIWLTQRALMLRLVLFSYQAPYFQQMVRGRINLMTAKFTFNKRITSIREVQYMFPYRGEI